MSAINRCILEIIITPCSLANHGDFYTNANVISAFKKYIDAWVQRYKNETGILAWELANEPRCRGSNSQAGSCNTNGATITAWAKDISAYIKSIDPNHLVGLGDEGFYARSNPPSYPYGAGEGIDFDENLKIPTLDFGTFHMYPDVCISCTTASLKFLIPCFRIGVRRTTSVPGELVGSKIMRPLKNQRTNQSSCTWIPDFLMVLADDAIGRSSAP